ncbi:hypothetical protein EYF80_064513 [Liparis tanakae]|uniref:Uncharacterized protein n=1 Tax=Liparis tanakae TaxID=230148 RepID=A0A4Z2E983_9TELE|nr:hypothetical protein EYF80_064513 [Liparis tanakae]
MGHELLTPSHLYPGINIQVFCWTTWINTTLSLVEKRRSRSLQDYDSPVNRRPDARLSKYDIL